MLGAILMLAAAVAAWVYVFSMEEKEPEEKVKSTGVVEQAISTGGATAYVIRFTGEKNKSYLAKTVGYTGATEKYEDGKLVHINYWFGKKAPGVEILDGELTEVPPKSKGLLLLIGSAVLFVAGILLVALR